MRFQFNTSYFCAKTVVDKNDVRFLIFVMKRSIMRKCILFSACDDEKGERFVVRPLHVLRAVQYLKSRNIYCHYFLVYY